MSVLENKTNRITVCLSLLFLSAAILTWSIALGHPGASWIIIGRYLMWPFILLAIMITTIIFRSRIARIKLWKKVVLLVTICVLILVLNWPRVGI